MWETIKNNKDEYMVERPKYLCYNIITKMIVWVRSLEQRCVKRLSSNGVAKAK